MCTLLYKYKFTENYYIFWEYHKCILSHLSWIVVSTMNLISGTHNYMRGRSVHLCYSVSILYNYPKFTLKRTLIVDVIHHLILKWILMEWVIFALFGHWYILSLSRSLSDIVSGCTYNDFPLQRKLGLNFLLHYCNYHL